MKMNKLITNINMMMVRYSGKFNEHKQKKRKLNND